ncbi:MAG: 50S ribosomal protein L30 [Myxococcota bacterium]|jgi:large subunit ribosomal protein L30|nr:50S ribosomal protein L30 [Myxococcota bacterium]
MAIAKLKVTQVKSLIAQEKRFRGVIVGLGLGRIGKSVIVENTPAFRGMIKKVIHLVKVEDGNV